MTKDISASMKMLLSYLNQNLYGKKAAVRLALLSAVANESIFFMGPPGTAKSMISRRIAAAFRDFYTDEGGIKKFTVENGGYFEYLMNEFSTPDEICGPVDLSALNEKPSRYTRQTQGYLPSAKVAFLDEIWKSGPAILNTLLTIINEKKFHNGSKVEKVPLVSLAAASNELPEKERGLEALWDRFVLRVFVNPVPFRTPEEQEQFFRLVDDDAPELSPTPEQFSALLSIADVENWQAEINKVALSDEAKDVITAIKQQLALLNQDEKHTGDEAYYVSDRRWKKIVHVLKTSAFLNGRSSVDLMDCSLIAYAIWNTDAQHKEVGAIVGKILKQNGISTSTAITDIGDQIDTFRKTVDATWIDHIVVPAVAEKPAKEIIKKINNEDCYECVRDDNGQTWYVGVNALYSSCHNIYSSNKKHYTDSWFSKNGDKLSCCYDFTVKKTKAIPAVPAKDYLEAKLFEPVAKKAVLALFDKEHYTPIMEQIDSEIADLQQFRDESAEPFERNLFANQKYRDMLLEKIEDSILALKKKKSELEAQHARYASDANIQSDFALGDIVLKDGTTKKAGTKVETNAIIAKVCLLGDDEKTAYGIAWHYWSEKSFAEAKKVAKNYGKEENFTEPYDSDWRLPTIEEWEQIYQNKDKVSGLTLEGRYWSSSKKGNDAVYYFDFATGKRDYTTPDHPYNMYVIRKLAL